MIKRPLFKQLRLLLVAPFMLTLERVSGQEGEVEVDVDGQVEIVKFANCDIDDYYKDLPGGPKSWTRDELRRLLIETQRNELPVVGETLESDDVYHAIIDLDPGTKNDTVRLIYRDINMNANPHGSPFYWDIERLWPVERGSSRPSPAYTDVHHIRPADYTVLEKRGTLSFGACNTVEYAEFCVSPATTETAIDTAQDGKIWEPPARFRGDIARAMLYVDLRYRFPEGSSYRSLQLQDCGPFEPNSMGYLSQLMEWSQMDPPDEAEKRRNDRACSRWQGNRNPFIDYPELAEIIHGPPEPLLENSKTYQSCLSIPTPSPTATPNECAKLVPGDYPFFLINSDDPDEVVIFPLNDMPSGIQLFLTDNAWDGKTLLENEGTLTMTVPDDGISAGVSFGYGEGLKLNDEWEVVQGEFSLNKEGDNLFLYCIDDDNLPHFLAGILFTGEEWMEPGLADYGSSSALPSDLEDAGSVYLIDQNPNNLYGGKKEGSVGVLRLSFVDQENWSGTDLGRYELLGQDKTLAPSKASVSTTYMLSIVLSTVGSFVVTFSCL